VHGSIVNIVIYILDKTSMKTSKFLFIAVILHIELAALIIRKGM
jgi:hypothetical protein